jgi:hypothetical protein
MSRPNGGLITETNRQYYAGAQQFYIDTTGSGKTFTSTFDTDLVFGGSDPATGDFNKNNFKLFTSPDATVWTELTPSSSSETGIVTNATGVASTSVDLTTYNSDIQVGMTVTGLGVDSGTTVLSTINPGTSITGNAYVPFVTGNIGSILSNYSVIMTANITADIQALGANAVVDDPNPAGVGTFTVYDPPTFLQSVSTNAGVTTVVWNKLQSGTANGMLLRFQPAITGTTTLTLSAYNASIVAGMGVSGPYVSSGTIVVSNTNSGGRSVIVLSKVMTQRADSNGAYSFFKQEITLNKNATVVDTEVLTFKNASPFTAANNIVTVNVFLAAGTYLKIQLDETTMWDNNGSYSYTTLHDIIDNFLIAYVGAGKLIPSVKRTDVIFHAKRGLQEFSYDTLQSVKSQEVSIPQSLSIIIPQDFVNYVRLSWIDELGVQHTIFPANTLTSNPYTTPAQDNLGVPTQDNIEENIEGTSVINERWAGTDPARISGALMTNQGDQVADIYRTMWGDGYTTWLGQRYGMNPETSQRNGWFTIDERKGMFTFTNNLKNKIVLIEYISDGNAYEMDTRIPKMAEEALYAHIIHAILSVSTNVQEYVIRRFKQERSAKLRNAKIRLSNIKLDQIMQVMRGKSKWLKF